jgi:hypothetical protein
VQNGKRPAPAVWKNDGRGRGHPHFNCSYPAGRAVSAWWNHGCVGSRRRVQGRLTRGAEGGRDGRALRPLVPRRCQAPSKLCRRAPGQPGRRSRPPRPPLASRHLAQPRGISANRKSSAHRAAATLPHTAGPNQDQRRPPRRTRQFGRFPLQPCPKRPFATR